MDRIRSSLLGYPLAVVLILATVLGHRVLNFESSDNPLLILFIVPIILSAYVGGLGPGLLATALSALTGVYYLLSPIYSLRVERTLDRLQLVVLCLSGVLISLVLEAVHRSRRELQESIRALKQHAQLLEHAPVLVRNLKDEIMIWNSGMEKMFGFTSAEAVGRRVPSLLQTSFAEQPLERIKDTVLRKGHWEGELRHLARDGRRLVVSSLWLLHTDSQGKPSAIIQVFNDITERQRAAEELDQAHEETQRQASELRAVLDSMVEGVAVYDAAGACIRNNPGLKRICGVDLASLTREQQLDHMQHINLRHPDGRPLPLKEHPACRALAGETVVDQVVLLTRLDGQEVYLSVSATPLVADGRLTGAITVGHEITERMRAETERERLQARVQYAQKMESLGVLAGGVAHDFNNLLQSVQGGMEMAMLDCASLPQARSYLAQAMKAANRAANLSRQMLAYSGKGHFQVQPLDLNTVITDTSSLLEASIPKKIVVKACLAPSLPSVEADPTQIQQLVMNLVLNAAEACGDKEGCITLATGVASCRSDELKQPWLEYDPPAGRYVFLEVTDNGCGMESATVPRIFDPFFTTKFQGRGLGMSVVLGIVRGCGGSIRVRSEPSRGTAFSVLLPASSRPAREDESPPPFPFVANFAKLGQPGTILVVDDDEGIRQVVSRALQSADFTVLTANEGYEALGVFQDHKDELSLVLLDLSMPCMGGEETLKRLLAIRPDLPILVWSGYSETHNAERLLKLGAAGFIEKPFHLPNLIQRVTSLIAARAVPVEK